jgi:integrase/recombinase XerD
MKPFKSPLADYLEQYIAYRRSLGYDGKKLRCDLRQFDRYVCSKSALWADLSASFFWELKKDFREKQHSFNQLLLTVRGFFAFLVRNQILAYNPLLDIAAYRQNAYIPFVFSAAQTDQLLAAAAKRIRKDPRYFLADYGRYLAIVLMARCGLRIGEPLRLKLNDYDSARRSIYIEKTKFNKDRLLALPLVAGRPIDNYLAVRSRFVKTANLYLICGKSDAGLRANFVRKAFQQAAADIGCNQPRRIIANTTFGSPTAHSLRHSFAINTLLKIKQRGRSPQQALPVLSAYLGHRKYRYTAVYLKVIDAKKRQQLVDFAIGRQEEL